MAYPLHGTPLRGYHDPRLSPDRYFSPPAAPSRHSGLAGSDGRSPPAPAGACGFRDVTAAPDADTARGGHATDGAVAADGWAPSPAAHRAAFGGPRGSGSGRASRGESAARTDDAVARLSARLSSLASIADGQCAAIERSVGLSAAAAAAGGSDVSGDTGRFSTPRLFSDGRVSAAAEREPSLPPSAAASPTSSAAALAAEVASLRRGLAAKDALVAAQRREIEALRTHVAGLERRAALLGGA